MNARRWLPAVALAACTSDAAAPTAPADSAAPDSVATVAAESAAINPRLLRRFRPVVGAVDAPRAPALVALGRTLYYDKSLSLHRDVSCNTCHPLTEYGVDHRPQSIGSDGRVGTRNAPSVFNAYAHLAQFWDGRAPDVERQALGPMLNPTEMAMPDEASILGRLATPAYASAFAAAFPGSPQPISIEHIGVAIGAFERGLATRSRWDDYLAGDARALGAEEKKGLKTFLEVGCVGCHTGPQVGGTRFERVGAVEPWPSQADLGRYTVTHVEADRMVFKVPSLKNITETAPYFHDGSVAKLTDAIRLMGRHQLGVELSDDEVAAIAAWMGSLRGNLDTAYIAPR